MKFSQMSSRERVLAAARGDAVDQVPVMYWLNPHMAIRLMDTFEPAKTPMVNQAGRFLWRRFRKKAMNAGLLWRGLPLLLSDYANAEYALQLGSDIGFTAAGANAANFVKSIGFSHGELRIKGPWGSRYALGGIYMEVSDPVIGCVDDLESYRFPKFDDFSAIRRFREKFPDACVAAEAYGVQDISFTQLWDMSQFMLAMMDYPDQVKAFFRKFGDWAVDLAYKSALAGADLVVISDDYGSTGMTQISPKMWREFTLPQLKRIIDAVHEGGAVAMLHSCGYVMPLLADLADAELDIVQSFQPKAGNDLAKAVHEYGDRLTFCTGIDIQRGEMMTADELRHDIIDQYHTGKQKHRFILGMTHNLQYTMPEENYRMIFDTVRQIQMGEVD